MPTWAPTPGSLVDVRTYGARGDGSTDDTAAIQAALNVSTSSHPKTIWLPTPTSYYRITDTLTVPFAPGTSIVGDGREVSAIQQDTAGKAVFLFSANNLHTITLRDLTLQYSSVQSNSGSVAILYDGTAGSGWYHHVFERLAIKKAYDGFACEHSDGIQIPWNISFRDLLFFNIGHSAVNFLPATSTGAGNGYLFENVHVNNAVNGGNVSTGQAFALNAAPVCMDNIECVGWYNEALQFQGGCTANVRNLHLETHLLSNATARAVYNPDSWVTIDGFQFNATTTAGCTTRASFADVGGASAHARLVLKNGYHTADCTLGAPATKELVYSAAGNPSDQIIEVSNVTKSGGDLNQPGAGSTDTQEYLHAFGLLPSGQRGILLPGRAVVLTCTGTPEAAVTAPIGSLALRLDGGATTTLYVKTSGTGNTGWTAK